MTIETTHGTVKTRIDPDKAQKAIDVYLKTKTTSKAAQAAGVTPPTVLRIVRQLGLYEGPPKRSQVTDWHERHDELTEQYGLVEGHARLMLEWTGGSRVWDVSGLDARVLP